MFFNLILFNLIPHGDFTLSVSVWKLLKYACICMKYLQKFPSNKRVCDIYKIEFLRLLFDLTMRHQNVDKLEIYITEKIYA